MKKRVGPFKLFGLVVFVLTSAFVFSACSNSSPSSPEVQGAFAGLIALYDSNGHMMTDFSGTTVRIDSTSMSTTTDSYGNWTLNNVPAGQYNITATHAGFGTFHWFEQLLQNGRKDLQTAVLGQLPNITLAIKLFQVDTFGVTIIGSPHAFAVPYCDTDSTVVPSAAHLAVGTGSWTESLSLSLYDLKIAGVRPGQTIYVSASTVLAPSALGVAYATTFLDPLHHEIRYASTGPKSNVLKVVMP